MKFIKKHSITLTFILAVLGFLFGRDVIKNYSILTILKNSIYQVYDFFISFLNYNLKIWWVIIVIIILILLLNFLLKQEEELPEFLNYKSKVFNGWKWSWDWVLDSDNTWLVSNLQVHCSSCQTPMIEHSESHYMPLNNDFECPRCRYRKVSKFECGEPYKISKVILDDIKRKVNRE